MSKLSELLEVRAEIKELRTEFDALSQKQKFSLGSKGITLLSKIHKLNCKLDAIGGG